MRLWQLAVTLLLAGLVGCGSTRSTNTARTATEQLLISDAVDRAVSRIDFRALAGRTVFLDSKPLAGAIDSAYLISTLRQHLLASGCILKDKREEADYVVEARAGVVGTDQNELMFGVPSVNVPSVIPVTGLPSSIPEIPIAKKTEQRAVAKIALFAYNRKTGRPVWQSGILPVESTASDIWVAGAGPFQRGTIYEGTRIAGKQLNIPLVTPGKHSRGKLGAVSVADEAYFAEPKIQVAKKDKPRPKKVPHLPKAKDTQEQVAEKKDANQRQRPTESSKAIIPASHTSPMAKPESQNPLGELPAAPQPPAAPLKKPSLLPIHLPEALDMERILPPGR